MLAIAWLSGCGGLQVRHQARSPSQINLDGLELADRRTNTSTEVISMLGLQSVCTHDRPACAEAIVAAPGTVREAQRLIASADILRRAADRLSRTARHDAWLTCAQQTHRYLHAPRLPGRESAMSARSQLALRLHNACTAGYAKALLATRGPQGLVWSVDTRSFPVAAIERVDMAREVVVHGLRTRQVQDGLGVAAVASGHNTGQLAAFPDQPFALAINIRFQPGPDGEPRLVATDASGRHAFDTALGTLPQARDMSAAYALAAAAFEREISRWGGLFEPDDARSAPEIRLLSPIQPDRTPVILIHGLASSPVTWANMVNELLGDPDISDNFQFWLVRYSTALPLLVNRQQLTATLQAFRATAGAHQGELPPAVVVGHSLGGVITRLLVTDPGTRLWNAAFTTYPAHFPAESGDGARAHALFLFEPVPQIDEVVFIAAPHGGSHLADGWLGRMVKRFIRTPGTRLDYLVRMTSRNPDVVQPELRENYLAGGPSSIGTLSPAQAVSRAGRQLPVVDGVRVHSIVGIRNPDQPGRGDGVVALDSAHWPQGEVTRVRGGHDLQTEPETIDVLKRILLERLARLNRQPERTR